ncbi:OsmC family protein [Falsiroseomonas selenitidurans]|uniref:OsmC family protein n=1 Tax=Falsiroseomonas selenitidurans TaxID=2716335 RepID=A0ABX1E6U3_9PROT|nr:OsmC family protein [Falsiroseomonas selenitidurans]NKC32924.1 OsmC family protein [Falsiroseomonas selenitidurans]
MASITRSGSAHWEGGGKDGTGHVSTQSGVLKEAPYGFNARFGDGRGTNPEELIAAAHAGCFTMALAFQLAGAGLTAERMDTAAKLSMEQVEGGFRIVRVALTLKAKVPGCEEATFQELAATAKANCPVSKVLNAEITLEATLEG